MKSNVPKVDKRVTVKDSKTDHIELYDSDNRYPQRIIDIINASGTAKRSVELFAKYIVGGGFKDKLFYGSIINKKGLTADKLLRAASFDYAQMGGRAYHINYNGLLQKSEISHIPFEYCRLGIGEKKGMIAVYEDWECTKESRIDATKIVWYHRYTNDQSVTLAQIQQAGGIQYYNGQIYTDSKYPLAPIDAVIEDAISDKSIKTFTKKELDNGFNPSAVARYTKNFDGKEQEQQWEELKQDWKTFQGPENTGKVFLQSGVSKDDFDLTRFDNPNQDKMYESTSARIKRSIRECFGQPPSLLGARADNAVFSSQNIEDDTKFYNSVTTDYRLLFEEDMKIIFENFHIKVNETNDWSILELTFNAIATEKPAKISTLGIGGTQALMSVLQSDLGNEQKINTITLVFGFTTEEAQSMVLPITTTPVV
jgi:hypothetical protein